MAAEPPAATDGRLAASVDRLDAPPPAVTFGAELHLRATALTDAPASDVVFDPARQEYRTDRYLVPEADDRFASAVARLRLDGRHLGGDLAWSLTADTGELRRRRDWAPVGLCASATSPSGFAPCASGGAGVVPGTAEGETRLLSNGRTLGEEARATWLLREANLRWTFGRAGFAKVQAGLDRLTIADGLIHDDDATGLDLALDLGALGPPVALRLAAYLPTRDLPWREPFSPLLLAEAAWQLSLVDRIGLFVAARRDRADGVARLLDGTRLEAAVLALDARAPGTPGYKAATLFMNRVLTRPPTSDATLAWAGVSGTLRPWSGQRLTFTGALSGGRIHRLELYSGNLVAEDAPLSGQAASVRWASSVADWLTLTPWFLYLSGDHAPAGKPNQSLSDGYRGFLGVTPLVTATNLFFQGGVSETFSARRVAAPGVNGCGVVAAGLTAGLDLPGEVDLAGRAAWLQAPVAGPFGGRHYGTELDGELSWQATPWLVLALEGDVLFPGDFFAGSRTTSKVVLALDVVTP